MTLRSAVLGSLTLLALARTATAGEGFYIGLGSGWDGQNNMLVNEFTPPPALGTVSSNDGAILAGTLGIKTPMIPIRLEFESGYDWHSISQFSSGGYTYGAAGHSNVASELINAIYDFPVGPGWNIYGGAGLGAGHVYFAPYLTDTGNQIAHVDHWGFMWQAIGGISFEVAPDADLFIDYRYRDAMAKEITYTPFYGPVGSHGITENVVMAGVRFYLFPPAPPPEAPAPAQYYNQPAPPPPGYSPPPSNSPTSGGATSGGASTQP